MIFHLSYELPVPKSQVLDSESPEFTPEEVRILKQQIRRNSVLINDYVHRLDLFVNKERYPGRTVFVEKLRRRLELLMEENDTFRKTLCKHLNVRNN